MENAQRKNEGCVAFPSYSFVTSVVRSRTSDEINFDRKIRIVHFSERE